MQLIQCSTCIFFDSLQTIEAMAKAKILIPSYSFIATRTVHGVGDDRGSWWVRETLGEGEVVHEPLTV